MNWKPKTLIHKLINKEEVFTVARKAVKPSLTMANPHERFQFAMSKIAMCDVVNWEVLSRAMARVCVRTLVDRS